MTILLTMGVGHTELGSIGVGPQAQTVAGIDVIVVARERGEVLARRVPGWFAVARAGALGEGLWSGLRRVRGGRVESVRPNGAGTRRWWEWVMDALYQLG